MSSIPPSLALLVRLQETTQDRDSTLEEVYRRYFFRMVALLRKRLPGHLARKVEADDLAQSAWGSFLGGLARRKFDLEGRDSLWPLLALIAIRKYQDLLERSTAQCRDVARESSLDEIDEGPSAIISPLEELAVQETVQLLEQRLGDEHQRQILRLRLEERSIEEIAEAVQLSARSVKRVLSKIREIWEELFRERGEAPPIVV